MEAFMNRLVNSIANRVLTGAACLLLTVPLLADDDLTRITVDVRTIAGRPVERASVTLKFVEGRSIVKLGKKINKQWELRTNHEGLAKAPELPKGKIQLLVHAKGYQTYGDTVDVNEDEKTITVTLKPPQSQYSAH
jgi:hypothetical protein